MGMCAEFTSPNDTPDSDAERQERDGGEDRLDRCAIARRGGVQEGQENGQQPDVSHAQDRYREEAAEVRPDERPAGRGHEEEQTRRRERASAESKIEGVGEAVQLSQSAGQTASGSMASVQ